MTIQLIVHLALVMIAVGSGLKVNEIGFTQSVTQPGILDTQFDVKTSSPRQTTVSITTRAITDAPIPCTRIFRASSSRMYNASYVTQDIQSSDKTHWTVMRLTDSTTSSTTRANVKVSNGGNTNNRNVLRFRALFTTNALRSHLHQHPARAAVIVTGGAATAVLQICVYSSSQLVANKNVTIVTPLNSESVVHPSYDLSTRVGELQQLVGETRFSLETHVHPIFTPNQAHVRPGLGPITAATFEAVKITDYEIKVLPTTTTNKCLPHERNVGTLHEHGCVQLWTVHLGPEFVPQRANVDVALRATVPQTHIAANLTFVIHIVIPTMATARRAARLARHSDVPQVMQVLAQSQVIHTIPLSHMAPGSRNAATDVTTVFTDAKQSCVQLVFPNPQGQQQMHLDNATIQACLDLECAQTTPLTLVANGHVTADAYHYAAGALEQTRVDTEDRIKLCYRPDITRQGPMVLGWRLVDATASSSLPSPRQSPQRKTIHTHNTAFAPMLFIDNEGHDVSIGDVKEADKTKVTTTPSSQKKWCEDRGLHCDGLIVIDSVVTCPHDYIYDQRLGRCMLNLASQSDLYVGFVVISLIITILVCGIIVMAPDRMQTEHKKGM